MPYFDFDAYQGGERKLFFVEAKCLEVAVREARHRFDRDRLNDSDTIDLSSGRKAFAPSPIVENYCDMSVSPKEQGDG